MFKPYQKAEISFNLGVEIGQEGSNSKTYVAHDSQLDAEVVIKQIQKSQLDSVDTFFDESKILYLTRIFHKTGRISLNPLIKLGLRQ